MNVSCFSCSVESGPSVRESNRLERLTIELSGVRNSWLTFETTRDLTSDRRRRESAFSSISACSVTMPRAESSSC